MHSIVKLHVEIPRMPYILYIHLFDTVTRTNIQYYIRETCHKQLPVVNLFVTEMTAKCHYDHFPQNSTRLKHELAIKGKKKN